MSSLSAVPRRPSSSVYCATKFGLRGFALGLRDDLVPNGVGVTVVFPGFIRDAGMFAESGAKLPPGVGTKTPEDVARAVVRAIESDRAEIDVAPLALRAGAAFAGSPGPRRRGPAPLRRGYASRRAPGVERGQANKRAASAAAAGPRECATSARRAGAVRARSAASRGGPPTAASTSLARRGPSASARRGEDAHDDLVAVDLLERDRAARRASAS